MKIYNKIQSCKRFLSFNSYLLIECYCFLLRIARRRHLWLLKKWLHLIKLVVDLRITLNFIDLLIDSLLGQSFRICIYILSMFWKRHVCVIESVLVNAAAMFISSIICWCWSAFKWFSFVVVRGFLIRNLLLVSWFINIIFGLWWCWQYNSFWQSRKWIC